MLKITTRGETVYQCTVCNRKTRVQTNKYGLDIIHYCTITNGCKGKLNKVTLIKDIINTPTITPSVINLQNWVQRKILYTHAQSIKSKKWIINHNLNNNPIAHVFIDSSSTPGTTKLIPVYDTKITPIDLNTTIIEFKKMESGVVQFVSPASQLAIPPVIVPNTDNIQVSSSSGIITIATKNATDKITISLTFIGKSFVPVSISYDVDNIVSYLSPWTGVNRIEYNNDVYTVRDLNLFSTSFATKLFLEKTIPLTGAFVFVNTIDEVTNNYDKHNILLLRSTFPYSSIDRVYDDWIDFGTETPTSNQIMYENGQILAAPNKIEKIFPRIHVV